MNDDAEAYRERAAIIEFDGGIPRREANRLAAAAVYGSRMELPDDCPDCGKPCALLSGNRYGCERCEFVLEIIVRR